MSLKEEKEHIRKSIYDKLFNECQSLRPNGDYGKIPNFKGFDIAAELLASTDEWKNSKTVFCSPDSAQIPVRYIALKENKNIVMASPNLEHGYLYLEGNKLVGKEKEASTKEGAFEHCSKFFDFGGDSFDMAIDMVVEGSVGVDRLGNRIGKGKGFADREIEDLFNRNLISEETPLVTTIHPFQLVEYVPMESHDRKLNMIVTTDEIIRI
ncbi:5-formyltetrahydrofolate cyclo-ligase [Methanobrevibacter sp.]|uniref:5-formyltetrahydrofolate cyclo-ligase n=1 Tax=Methanobrevibacter sp. TaxID=66852 RepID=UPI0025DA9C6F|nr:5-formyltetrahydrofolate cyclo-ligase [Methanobrevibacter sp.]MBQ2962618.1 5-formyltetrahydrofolate cyclo-ligase [Methanobrevibacter sp.]